MFWSFSVRLLWANLVYLYPTFNLINYVHSSILIVYIIINLCYTIKNLIYLLFMIL